MVKNLTANAGDMGLIPVSGRSPGGGHGNPLQYSCLENPMDGGAWGAIVHGVAESRTRLSSLTFTFAFNTYLYKCIFSEQAEHFNFSVVCEIKRCLLIFLVCGHLVVGF